MIDRSSSHMAGVKVGCVPAAQAWGLFLFTAFDVLAFKLYKEFCVSLTIANIDHNEDLLDIDDLSNHRRRVHQSISLANSESNSCPPIRIDQFARQGLDTS